MAKSTKKDYEKFLSPLSFVKDDGKLVDLKYKPLAGSAKFTEDTFATGYDNLQELTNANPASYSKLMLGDEKALLGEAAGDVENSRRAYFNFAQTEMHNHTRNNAKDLATLVWKEDGQSLLGLSFGMDLFRKRSGNKYNRVIDQIETAKDEEKKAKEDAPKHLNEKMNTLNDAQKAFFIPFGEKIISEYVTLAQNSAIRSMGEYGIPKFVSDNIQTANTLGDKQAKDMEKLQDQTRKAIERLGDNPVKEEVEKLKDHLKSETERISGKYQNALNGVLPILNTLAGLTRDTIETKRQKAKAKKK